MSLRGGDIPGTDLACHADHCCERHATRNCVEYHSGSRLYYGGKLCSRHKKWEVTLGFYRNRLEAE